MFIALLLLAAYALLIAYAVIALSPDRSFFAARKPLLLLLNFLPVYLPSILLFTLFNRLWASVAATAVFCLALTLVNRFKVLIRQEPFLPSDFILIREAALFSGAAKGHTGAGVIAVFVCAAAACALSLLIPLPEITGTARLLTALCCTAAVWLLNHFVYKSSLLFERFPEKSAGLADSCCSCGFAYSFWHFINRTGVEKPEGYEKSLLPPMDAPQRDAPIKINVIFIMAEAFTTLSDNPFFSFDTNPLAAFRQLEGEKGKLIVPNYGGGTSNTEFDVFTGLNTMFINPSPSAFWHVRKPLPSVVSAFRNLGYSTTAIHPGYGWVYGRKKVYPRLGFDRFLTISDFSKEQTEFKGGLVSDRSAFQKLREVIEGQKTPSFTYLLTIQTHTPFNNKFERGAHLFEQARPLLSPREADILSNYFIGISDTDRELGAFTEYLNNRPEPYLLLFYGDHLPALGSAMRIYDELGYGEGLGKLEADWLLWQNNASKPLIDLRSAMKNAGAGGTLSANFLGPLVLELLGMDCGFFEYVNSLRKRNPVLTVHAPPEDAQAVREFRYVQYNRMTQK